MTPKVKNLNDGFLLTSDSEDACEDYCIYDAGYNCIFCERFCNTKLYKESNSNLELDLPFCEDYQDE